MSNVLSAIVDYSSTGAKLTMSYSTVQQEWYYRTITYYTLYYNTTLLDTIA